GGVGPMYHNIRSADGTQWQGFVPLPGAGTTQPGYAQDMAITGMPDGSAQALIVGADGGVYHNVRNAAGTAWQGFQPLLGGASGTELVKGSDVAIAGMPDGSAQVLIVG